MSTQKINADENQGGYSFRPLVILGQGDQLREIRADQVRAVRLGHFGWRGLAWAALSVLAAGMALGCLLATLASDGTRGAVGMILGVILGAIAITVVAPAPGPGSAPGSKRREQTT